MNETLTLNAEVVFEFKSYFDWINNASNKFKPYGNRFPIVCVNTEGKICHNGADFMYSLQNNLYPIKAYLLQRAVNLQNEL
ncbi:hypothetical protein [Emticicia sp. BO119]|uniref:hypothetical protein n=1 Tax=Emticicia sp. BO119 TaxID=2757768 RepID=UPI0015F0E0DF|nr:hypothetical protein [Emticicia sp. BO119]MBA4852065.1 hypothetical protein [Emticicia sp. BO119]